MKPQTMFRITATLSLIAALAVSTAYVLNNAAYAKQGHYPPILWSATVPVCFIITLVIAFLIIGHFVTTINKIIKNARR
jgi:hypothetical protein